MTNIEELIPHRNPFLFVDEISTATTDEIIAYKTFHHHHTELKGSFPQFNFVPGTILVESMAQCGGAGIKQLGITDGLFGLASIDNMQILAGVEYEQKITYKIKNIRISDKIIKQSGIAYVNEIPVMEATWMCVKLK